MGIENELARQAANARARVATLAPVIGTALQAAGNVIFDTTIIPGVLPIAGSAMELRSVELVDEDDQGVALDLVFFDSAVSLGAVNGAPSISDANARSALGFVSLLTTDYIDVGGARIASKANIGLVLQAAASDLYVAAITRGGTPTYTVSGLKLKFGFST